MKLITDLHRKIRRLKLNVKVVLFMFVVVLSIMTIVISYSFSMTKAILIEQSERNLALENENITTSIRSIFEQKGEAVYQLTMLPVFQQFMQEDLPLEAVTSFEKYDELQETLTEIDQRNEDFFLASLIHEKNNYFISGHGYISDPSYDITSREWYDDASKSDGLSYSSPYVDYETNEWTFLITYPIHKERERVGFFSATLHMNLIDDELEKFEDNNKKIIIVTESGRVLHDKDYMWETISQSNLNQNSIFKVEKNDEHYYVSTSKLNTLGWNIAVYVPESEVLAPLTNFQHKTFLTWGTTISILLISLALVLQYFLKDIPFIVQQIHNIKNGNFKEKTFINRHDEIGEISAAIDEMAVQIEHQMSVLDYHANHDKLTGIANRAALEERLQLWIREAKENEAIVVTFLDLDFFKTINDSKGHAQGDVLLKEVAQRIHNILLKNSFFSRFGGDEFVLIIRTTTKNLQQAYELIEKIQQSFSQPFYLHKQPVYMTTSMGVSIFREDAVTLKQLLVNADTALYHAKESGRNRIYYYNYDLKMKIEKELQLKNSLREALVNNQFHLHFQPQYNLVQGENNQVEVLLRWQHPEMGNISPAEFIPLAEQTGLIVDIGDWVLDASLQMYKRMEKRGIPLARFAINISAIQFQEADFVQKIARKLDQYNVPATSLEIEITESVIIHQPDEMIQKLLELSKLGVCISLDDFGTGYSSLNYLRTMPIDYVKVDRAFISKIENDYTQRSILKMIVDLGHELNFEVIAEGVEEKLQLEILKDMGVDVIQGYFYSKPLSESDLVLFFLDNQPFP